MCTISREKFERHCLKNFLWIIYCISEMCMQLKNISEIKVWSEILAYLFQLNYGLPIRGGYLNV